MTIDVCKAMLEHRFSSKQALYVNAIKIEYPMHLNRFYNTQATN